MSRPVLDPPLLIEKKNLRLGAARLVPPQRGLDRCAQGCRPRPRVQNDGETAAAGRSSWLLAYLHPTPLLRSPLEYLLLKGVDAPKRGGGE